MTISQIPGAVRLRNHQFGVQTLLNTGVAATRRVPWRGPIEVNPNWTDPDVDIGSLDPSLQPYPGAFELTSNLTGVLFYNDIPLRNNAGLLGGVTPSVSSGAYTWDWQVASLTSDVFDIFTDQYSDDTEATDTITGVGGLINTLEQTSSTSEPWTINDNWVYSTGSVGGNATNGLTVDSNGIIVMGDETLVLMDSAAGSIGITPIASAVHEVTISVDNALDQKRFMNGSNGANQLGGYGRGPRVIELTLHVAKTAAMIAEANTLLTRPRPNRYFEVNTVSSSVAGSGSTKYSYRRRGAFRLFSRADTELGGNATLTLVYHGFYDPTGLGYAYAERVVNTQATVLAPPV